LRELDQEFIKLFVPRRELIFLSCIPVSPNCQRVVETSHIFSDGPRVSFVSLILGYKLVFVGVMLMRKQLCWLYLSL